MKQDDLKKYFKNESELMEKYRFETIHAQLELEEAEKNHDPDLTIYETAVKNAEREEDVFSEVYAKKIFDYLKVCAPVLIRKRNDQKVNWEEAFGADYSTLSKGLKASLIALVEDDGGQYRLE